MRGALGFLVVALLVMGALWYGFLRPQGGAEGANVGQAVVLTGVRNDLAGIVRAERAYLVQNGAYGTLEQLIASGDLLMQKPRRGIYVYTVEVHERSFVATAQPEGPGAEKWPTMTVNENMQFTEIPAGARPE
jgi:hypothetical protein